MRTLRKNRQKMYYSIPVGNGKAYERDKNGNIKYTTMPDGTVVPISKGGLETEYSTPVEFSACITSRLNEMHSASYGVSQSSIYSELCVRKGYMPLKYGMKIWKESEIKWIIPDKVPNPDSADFTVNGFMSEFLDYDYLLLQRTDK